ncbi:MAG: hypothetical protein H6808_08480 [Phycisphaera sp.]|nr:hypothetical protein [Phycisphaera sp.]
MRNLTIALILTMCSLRAHSQAVYTFDDLIVDQPLENQDGWRRSAGGNGTPSVIQDGDSPAISGTFKTAVRQSGGSFDFASECDADAIRLTFDVHYLVTTGNVSIQVYLYEDNNGDFVLNSGEGVCGYGLARNSTSIPTLQLQLVGSPVLNSDISNRVATGDRLTLRAELVQDENGTISSVLSLLNHSDPSPVWQTILTGDTLPEATSKRLSEVDSIQVRFDSGSAKIDNIEIVSLPVEPTPCALADMNHDGTTTAADFSSWVGCFNLGLGFPGCANADQNQDGILSPADFSSWVANYNSCQ